MAQLQIAFNNEVNFHSNKQIAPNKNVLWVPVWILQMYLNKSALGFEWHESDTFPKIQLNEETLVCTQSWWQIIINW
jgi:hypothetical protein